MYFHQLLLLLLQEIFFFLLMKKKTLMRASILHISYAQILHNELFIEIRFLSL